MKRHFLHITIATLSLLALFFSVPRIMENWQEEEYLRALLAPIQKNYISFCVPFEHPFLTQPKASEPIPAGDYTVFASDFEECPHEYILIENHLKYKFDPKDTIRLRKEDLEMLFLGTLPKFKHIEIPISALFPNDQHIKLPQLSCGSFLFL